jgi:hypothetical protein
MFGMERSMTNLGMVVTYEVVEGATSLPACRLSGRLTEPRGSDTTDWNRLTGLKPSLHFSDSALVRGTLGCMATADLPALLDTRHCVQLSLTFVPGEQDEWALQKPLRRVIANSSPQVEALASPGGRLLHQAAPDRAEALPLERLDRPERAAAG